MKTALTGITYRKVIRLSKREIGALERAAEICKNMTTLLRDAYGDYHDSDVVGAWHSLANVLDEYRDRDGIDLD